MVRNSLFVSLMACGFCALMACEAVDESQFDGAYDADDIEVDGAFTPVGLQSDAFSCFNDEIQNSIYLKVATDPKAHSYSFVAEKNQVITYSLDFGFPTPANIGAVLSIYNAAGSKVTSKTSYSTPKLTGTYTFTTAGTYYFTVSPYKTSGSTGMQVGVYYGYDLVLGCTYCAEAEYKWNEPTWDIYTGYSVSNWADRTEATDWAPWEVVNENATVSSSTITPKACSTVQLSCGTTGPKVCGYEFQYTGSQLMNNGKPFANKCAFANAVKKLLPAAPGSELNVYFYRAAIKSGYTYTCPVSE